MLRLNFFDARGNMLSGTIPPSIFEAPVIQILYLSNNTLEGPIPENYGQASLLRDLYLDGNLLSSTVPAIGENQLQFLTELLIQNNDVRGTMPDSLCALRTPRGVLEDLWADCLPSPQTGQRQVICSCCSQCFL